MNKLIIPITFVAALVAIAMTFLSSDLGAQEVTESAAASGPKWEYRALRITDRRSSGGRDRDLAARKSGSQDTLNQLGAQGWELVSVRNDGNNEAVFYLKRAR